MFFLRISKIISNFAAQNVCKGMDKPIFIEYKTPEERAAAFRRMIHLREEWEEHIRQIKAAKQMA